MHNMGGLITYVYCLSGASRCVNNSG